MLENGQMVLIAIMIAIFGIIEIAINVGVIRLLLGAIIVIVVALIIFKIRRK